MNNKGILLLTTLCVLLGFFAINSLGTAGNEIQIGGVTSAQNIERLLIMKNELEQEKLVLLNSVREMESIIKEYEDLSIPDQQTNAEILQLIWESRVLAGLTDLQGPGVRIILNDRPRATILYDELYDLSSYIVHDTDLLGVVNELRAAGAEAIEINGVRILANSRISCGGPTINIGRDSRFTPPFIIHAIGNKEEILHQFDRYDSISRILMFYGLEFQIEALDNVFVSRYYGVIDFNYAKEDKGGV